MSATLTAREREVADLIASGLRNREIAERLVLEERTVEAHARNIRRKLGLANRRAMQAYDVILEQFAW